MNLVNLSTALHRLTRLSTEEGFNFWNRHDRRIMALNDHIFQHLKRLSQTPDAEPHARCLSTIAWAYGRLQECNPEVMQIVGELAERWLTFFKSFELANLLWGFAKLQLGSPNLFRAAKDHVEARTQELSTRSLSLVAWALATATPTSCSRCLRKAAEAFASKLSFVDEKPVSLANLVWALATSGTHPRQETLHTVGRACAVLLGNFKANELSITLWAFTRLGCFHEELFAAATKRLCEEEGLRRQIHAQGIANTLWAFARLSEVCKEDTVPMLAAALVALLPTCRRLLPRLCAIEFSSMLCAVSKLAARTRMQASADTLLLSAAEISRRDPSCLLQLSRQSIIGLLGTYREHLERKQSSTEASHFIVRQLEHLHDRFGPPTRLETITARLEDDDGICASPEASFEAYSSMAAYTVPEGAFSQYGGTAPAGSYSQYGGMGHAEQLSLPPQVTMGGWEMMYHQYGHVGMVPPPFLEKPGPPQFLEMPPPGLEVEPPPTQASEEEGPPAAAFGHVLPKPEPMCIEVPPIDAFAQLLLAEDEVEDGPAFMIIPEFCQISNNDEDEVLLAFEIGTLKGQPVVELKLSCFDDGSKLREVKFTLTSGGVYSVRLLPQPGAWNLTVELLSVEGELILTARTLSFHGAYAAELDLDLHAVPEAWTA